MQGRGKSGPADSAPSTDERGRHHVIRPAQGSRTVGTLGPPQGCTRSAAAGGAAVSHPCQDDERVAVVGAGGPHGGARHPATAVAVICEVAEDVVALLDIAVPNGD